MKKWLICLLAAVLLLAAPAVSAGNLLVIDGEGMLSAWEEQSLSADLAKLAQTYGIDAVVITAEDFGGKNAKDYADDYFGENGYGDNGILLLVSMTQRKWHISTAGSCTSTFHSRALDSLEERIVPALKDGNVYDAFVAFTQGCENILSGKETPGQEGAWKRVLICLGIGAAVALVVVLVLVGQLKSVRRKNSATDYVRPGSLKLTQCLDLYLYQNTTRRAKPKSSSGPSGRSRGGRGGSF